MKVELLAYTPEPDRVCAAAARGCYSKKDAVTLYREMKDEEIKKILRKCILSGHLDVIEHANFTFSVSGVSRSLTHQLVRHRLASYSQQSQRYVELKLNHGSYIEPVAYQTLKPELRKKVSQLLTTISNIYYELIESGLNLEDTRMILPNATPTNITFTMNARELRHFLGQRCCFRAQWEIRHLANEILRLCKKVAPVIFDDVWAACRQLGYCPELVQCSQLKGKIPQLKDLKELWTIKKVDYEKLK